LLQLTIIIAEFYGEGKNCTLPDFFIGMCAMCVGFPNCPKGQKRVGKTKSSSEQSFSKFELVFSVNLQFGCSFFNLAGNGQCKFL
jgi:hypothetical protein